MRKRISGELLDRYLKGECSPEEKEFVKNWYGSFSQDNDGISDMNDIEKQLLRDRMFMEISGQLASEENGTTGGKIVRLKFLRYAAAVAVIGIAGYLALFVHGKKAVVSTSQMVTVNNAGKNIKEKTLNDGSHVWLSPGAQITYNRSFGSLNRQLSMSGEAFFEVTKNPKKPFIISSSHIVTEVWGTSFRVRDGETAASADVAVVTGKVSVSLPGTAPANINKLLPANSNSIVMLYPDQQVVYSGKDNALHTKQQKQPDLFIWKKVSLSFDNATIKDVIPLLNRSFSLNIHTNDETINNYYITVDFNGLNFPQIMEVLRTTLNISYQIDGNNVTLVKS